MRKLVILAAAAALALGACGSKQTQSEQIIGSLGFTQEYVQEGITPRHEHYMLTLSFTDAQDAVATGMRLKNAGWKLIPLNPNPGLFAPSVHCSGQLHGQQFRRLVCNSEEIPDEVLVPGYAGVIALELEQYLIRHRHAKSFRLDKEAADT